MIRYALSVLFSLTFGTTYGTELGLMPMTSILKSEVFWVGEWMWWISLYIGLMLGSLYAIDYTLNRWNQVARALNRRNGTRLPVYEPDSEGQVRSGQSQQRDAAEDVGDGRSAEGD